jgi:hypothetical protein
VACGIEDPHGLCAEGHQQLALVRQVRGVGHVAHQEDGVRLQPEVAGHPQVALRDVGLGAVRGDPDDIRPEIGRTTQVGTGAPARRHEDPHPAGAQPLPDRGQHLGVAEQRPADLQRRGAQPVPVANLDHRYPSGVGRGRVGDELLAAQLVAHGVVAVAQRRIVDQHRARAGGTSRLVLDLPRRHRTSLLAAAPTSRLAAAPTR